MLAELALEVVDGAKDLKQGHVRRQRSRVRRLCGTCRDILQVAQDPLQVDTILFFLQLILKVTVSVLVDNFNNL